MQISETSATLVGLQHAYPHCPVDNRSSNVAHLYLQGLYGIQQGVQNA